MKKTQYRCEHTDDDGNRCTKNEKYLVRIDFPSHQHWKRDTQWQRGLCAKHAEAAKSAFVKLGKQYGITVTVVCEI